MSTRSAILIKRNRNTYEGIYCHSDGYPSHQLPRLAHYDTQEKVEALITLGDLSILGARLAPAEGEIHTFDYEKRAEGVTVAYMRDRGDKGSEATTFNVQNVEDLKAKCLDNMDAEHIYYWNGKKWMHRKTF